MKRVRDARFPTGWVNVPVPEADRRQNHLSLVTPTHSILPIAINCLQDTDTKRPSAQQICHHFSGLKDTPKYRQSLETRAVGEGNGVLEEKDRLIQRILQEKEKNERENRDELQQKEEEIEKLSRKLAFTNVQMQRTLERQREVDDKLRDEIHQLRESLNSSDRHLQEKDQLLEVKEQELHEKDTLIHQLQQSQTLASYSYQVIGPGLQSATANHPTNVLVELSDSSGKLCSREQSVTAKLELVSKATLTSPSKNRSTAIYVEVTMISPSRYELSYESLHRGQFVLHITVNGRKINGSPFPVTVYPDPTQLGFPVRIITDVNRPFGIAFNSHSEMLVTECFAERVSVLDNGGQRIRTIEGHMKAPAGIAVDAAQTDNIYVTSEHKVQKYSSSGELVRCVGTTCKNSTDLERGITLCDGRLYICNSKLNRIEVYDLDLNFIRSIHGSYGGGREFEQFDTPHDVQFDAAGNMYIAEFGKNRVQVLDSSNHFVRMFGLEGEGALHAPSAVHIADKYVYVSDHFGHRLVVYETSGQYVTSLGRLSEKKIEFRYPYSVTSCADGFIYVCDNGNNRIQVF